jgi:hypothetical protein
MFHAGRRRMNTFTSVLLIVTIITAEDKQNIVDQRSMPDMDTCEAAAHEFLQHRFPDYIGAIGLDVHCRGKLVPENPL